MTRVAGLIRVSPAQAALALQRRVRRRTPSPLGGEGWAEGGTARGTAPSSLCDRPDLMRAMHAPSAWTVHRLCLPISAGPGA